MSVRPFYLRADAEGRRTEIQGGPRNSMGNMDIEIFQRDEGEITNPYTIRQRNMTNLETGEHSLTTIIYYNGVRIHEHHSKY